MGYSIIGRAIVERQEPDDDYQDGYLEILDISADSNSLYADEREDFEISVFSDKDVPAEPGVYVLMYAATLTGYQDYFGEWDVEATCHWMDVKKLDDVEAADVIKCFTTTYEEDKE